MPGDAQPLRAGVYARQSRGKKKSIVDQIREGKAVVEEQPGWSLAAVYQDLVSASRYGRKKRDDWDRVLADIADGSLDILVLWESSRGDRKLTAWSALLDLCREQQVKIHVVSHERTYHLDNHRDWKTLANDGVESEGEVNQLSVRVKRGVALSAKAGRPAQGPCPYGYRRTYDPDTGELAGQEPDPEKAPTVREIIRRVATSEPLDKITKDLNARGVPPPRGREWYRTRVRYIALNPVYVGERRHKDKTHPAGWPPISDDPKLKEDFFAAKRILADPQRTKFGKLGRPGRQRYMLTYMPDVAECVNGHHLVSTGGGSYYGCPKGCVGVRQAALDELVRDIIVARLSKPDAFANLRQAGEDDDREAAAARGEIAELEARLDQWRASAARGETTPASLAAIEADLSRQAGEARQRLQRANVPPALRTLLEPGADVAARWSTATLPARRDVVRALLTVRVLPAGQSAFVPVHERVVIRGPETGAYGL